MTIVTRIRQIGNSDGLTLRAEQLREAGIARGDEVVVDAQPGRIVITRAGSSREGHGGSGGLHGALRCHAAALGEVTRTTIYPPLDAILEAQRRLIEPYGGAGGVRDSGGVEAALARARQIEAYADRGSTVFAHAAAIGFGFARIHHPFVDGNKRIAFYASFATLWLNGWALDVAEHAAAEMLERVATGQVDEQAFVDWLEANSQARDT